MGRKIICRLFIASSILLLIGCSSTPKFHVNVDSLCSTEMAEKKIYILLPGNKDIKVHDLQFKEYANYVNTALQNNGFIQARNGEKAEIAIFLSYGIGDPQTHNYSYSIPTWGQTGVSSSRTYGSVYSYGGGATYFGYTTYTPQYGITGYQTVTGSSITYFRFMLLDAYDLDIFNKTNQVVQVWKTNVTSTGSSGDLREVFPILVAASSPYMGRNTGKK